METDVRDDKTSMYKEFEIDGTTLVYDFDELCMAQMKHAEAVYEYQADLDKRPPRTLREKIDLGGADYDQHVLSYILLKRQKDGSLQRFKGGETQRPILDLVGSMPAKMVPDAEEVIRDFFQRRGRFTLALLVRSKYETLYAERVLSKIMELQQQTTSSENSPTDDDASETSTSPVSVGGASVPASMTT